MLVEEVKMIEEVEEPEHSAKSLLVGLFGSDLKFISCTASRWLFNDGVFAVEVVVGVDDGVCKLAQLPCLLGLTHLNQPVSNRSY